MNIGLDLDEVITKFLEGFLEFYNRKFNSDYSVQDFDSYNFWDVLGGTRAEAIKLVDEFHSTEAFDRLRLVDGAKQGIEKLAARNKLYVITSRPLRFKEKTNRFFSKNFADIPFQLFYSNDFHGQSGLDKAELCLREKVEVFVEDNLEYALDCYRKGIKVCLFNKPWNQKGGNGLARANNWQEILQQIKTFGKK